MENVAAFNNELSGLYDSKPPISKAKMAAITRAAMRAIKFYKHVVQSVEKFILKCKPEYKVPGLYVIDSIVRQSRHQYGPEKDVFAPRFARNMKETFANLFRCAPEDKSRIIRVLNLWQKNSVFAPDVIQPIFDLADPNHPIYSMPPPVASVSSAGPSSSANLNISDMAASQPNGGLNTSGGSIDKTLAGGVSVGAAMPQQEEKLPPSGLADLSSASPHDRSRNSSNSMRQLDHKQHSKRSNNNASSMASTSKAREHSSKSTLESIKIHHPETYSKYQRNSHDYDYDDAGGHHIADDDASSDEGGSSPKNSNNLLDNNNLKQLLNDPNVLRQLQTLQNFTKFKQDDKQHNLRLQEEAFEKHLQNVLKNSASSSGNQDANDFNKEVEFVSEEQKIEVINLDGNDSRSPTPDRDRYKRRRSRSRSRSRDRGGRSRRGRSRSRSRSRSPRSSNRRRNSRDRERNNRDKERDREHERERRKKGLPDLKKEHLSVCSTTLWVGHLSKLVYQEELSDTFGEYGDIVSIDQIVPRGCAFIVMNRRQDAYKAMQGLKNHKLQGRAITISWAAGKGVKSKEWKDFWDLELGVTYIPWNKIDDATDFDSIEEGGMFDEDSMPGWMKEKISKLKSLKESANDHSNLLSGAGGIQGPPPTIPSGANPAMMFGIDTTQPPPGPPSTGGPPPILPMVAGQFSMAPPIGAPPRMLGPPHMGMPLSGIHMPPNIVPPHAMMMMPGFGGGPAMGPPHIPSIGGAHGAHSVQFPPPPGGPAASAMSSNVANDDQMDIEMEDEEGATLASNSTPANNLNFSQPPPSFAGGSSGSAENSTPATAEPFSRDRNRSGSGVGTRWGGRGAGAGPDDDAGEVGGRWHENGGPMQQGGPHNFPEGGPRIAAGGPPHRPDFMNDFDKRGAVGSRGGGGGGGGANFNGGGNDFHPNMQNRFNQPTNLMHMRIPPPNAFNQRGGPGGGPPMFMRGGHGGPGGVRQQGPGFFNRNNPFDRDISEGFGGRGRGRGGRGGGRGNRGGGGFGGGRDIMQGGGNWSDEEGDEGGFKRRGGGGNRFRDREGSADRFNMRDNNRGGRRGPGGPPRDRNDSERDVRGGGRGGGGGGGGTRRISRDDGNKRKTRFCDTEEDWDRELQDYDVAKSDKKDQKTATKAGQNLSSNPKTTIDNSNKAISQERPAPTAGGEKNPENTDRKENDQGESIANTTNIAKDDDSDKNMKSATPLYDELPPPKAPAVATAVVTEKPPANEATPMPVAVKMPPAETAMPQLAASESFTPAQTPAEQQPIQKALESAVQSSSGSVTVNETAAAGDSKPENVAAAADDTAGEA